MPQPPTPFEAFLYQPPLAMRPSGVTISTLPHECLCLWEVDTEFISLEKFKVELTNRNLTFPEEANF